MFKGFPPRTRPDSIGPRPKLEVKLTSLVPVVIAITTFNLNNVNTKFEQIITNNYIDTISLYEYFAKQVVRSVL